MTSTQSRDPRLNAHKRPPSRSPDGRLASNKRHAGDNTASTSLTHNSAGLSVGSGTLTDSPSPANTLENFFEACTAAAALQLELQSAQRELERADREYSLLKYQFHEFPAIKEQKTAARTRAQQKVERIERKISERGPEQRLVLNSLASLFNQSAASNAVPPSAPSVPNGPNSRELQSKIAQLEEKVGVLEASSDGHSPLELQSKIAQLEEKVGVLEASSNGPGPLELQSKVAQLEEKVRALEGAPKKLSNVDTSEYPKRLEQLEKSQSEVSLELPALRDSWKSLDAKISRLSEESLSRLAAVERLSYYPNQAIDPLKKETARSATELSELPKNLTNRLSTLEVESSQLSNAIAPLNGRVEATEADSCQQLSDAIAPLHERVGAVEAAPITNASSQRQSEGLAKPERLGEASTTRLDQLGQRFDELVEKFDELAAEKSAVADEAVKYVNAKIAGSQSEVTALRAEVERTVGNVRDTLRQGFSDDIAISLRLHGSQIMERITAMQHQSAEATDALQRNANDLLERLQRVEESQSSTASTEQLESLRKTVTELRERLEKTEKERVSRTQSSAARTPVWQPVRPSNDESEMYSQMNGIPPTAAANALVGRLSDELEALKGIASRHERLFNNFLTDEIVKQMVDQMSTMYPDAKNFQLFASALQAEVKSIQEALSALGGAVQSARQIPLLQQELGEATNRLKQDISNHTRRIEGCESMVEEGKTKLTNINKLETDIRVLTQSVDTLANAVQKVREASESRSS
ncbi:hypothetical protein CERZMDRAFT_104725 [Cercospora zeae-maydis SCOH1-5]|uniref:Uncharacterized protein n=1 Tax=Cercospora zeae-maydis SCOH1-5 TaxID=717836 RepID=A0A6A6FSB0_9PEZI|nr:hypothetical protein CERZMDRAFT_104725 [Cercospora zeae-maydis SCOH1-5]